MPNKIQPRPEDSIDEKTIEKNLKEMDYDPKDDVMRQGKVVDSDLENTDKQAISADDLSQGSNE